jgi:hypothetical protein
MGFAARFSTRRPGIPGLLLLALLLPGPGGAQSLVGSSYSMARQQQAAHDHEFDFLRTPEDVRRFVRAGRLVRVSGTSSFKLDNEVSFPYARPTVKTFLDRLGRQYKAKCGERLVVTSLVRPITRQPRNASHLSVHPTGMAVDLRWSGRKSCRQFLETTLLTLEDRGLVEATRERWPAHYHVTVYPGPYRYYLAGKLDKSEGKVELASRSSRRSTSAVRASRTSVAKSKKSEIRITRSVATRYRVRRGDTLVRIAERHRSSVERIRAVNGLRSTTLRPGQLLSIPAR